MAVPPTLIQPGESAMIIYLYVKQHNITGLKYFGKTKRNPHTYNGSGKYWKRHLSKHGVDITTLSVYAFDNINECEEFALKFSRDNNIVESHAWANLKTENGKDGGDNSMFIDYNKICMATKGKTYEEIHGIERARVLREQRSLSNTRTKRGVAMSEEQKQKRRHPYGSRSEEFKKKMSEVAKNRPKIIGSCIHCGKKGNIRNLKRWHFDRCKFKP